MFISDAYADAPAATTTAVVSNPATAPVDVPPPSPLAGMAPLLLILPIFYFLMIRPNQKRIKDFQTMVKSLKKGDRVVTGGGIIGVIQKIENDEVLVVEIAPEVKVRVMKETISTVISQTAVNDNKADAKKSGDKVTSN